MFKQILFPADGSVAALSAAEVLASILRGQSEAEVTLAVAYTPIDPGRSDYEPAAAEKHNEFLEREAQKYLDAAAGPFEAAGIRSHRKTIHGSPVSLAIAREAESGGYDAVAMGSRGMSMQESADNYLGSVTEHVIRRVSIPVIVIPVRR